MNLNTNIIYALITFAMGAVFAILAHTSFTGLLEPLFFAYFDDGMIAGMFRAMDAAYGAVMIISAIFLLVSTVFLIRYISHTANKMQRMGAVILATLTGICGVSIVATNLL